MLQTLRGVLRNTPVRPIYRVIKRRLTDRGRSQSNESKILERLVASEKPPMTFVEFGFHATEFNCIKLLNRTRGLLIDGDPDCVKVVGDAFPKDIEVVSAFLTLDNLDFIRNKFDRLGILSIDVDGNDYWLLDALITTKPAIIIAEYNATLGLRSVTVPYDPAFNRHQKHASGWYHGASIVALSKLAAQHGYGLAAVSDGGQNLFFTRTGKLNPMTEWRENGLRRNWSGKTVDEQWNTIKDLPFVEV